MSESKESLVVGRAEKPAVPRIENKDDELRTQTTDAQSQPRGKGPMSVP